MCSKGQQCSIVWFMVVWESLVVVDGKEVFICRDFRYPPRRIFVASRNTHIAKGREGVCTMV